MGLSKIYHIVKIVMYGKKYQKYAVLFTNQLPKLKQIIFIINEFFLI